MRQLQIGKRIRSREEMKQFIFLAGPSADNSLPQQKIIMKYTAVYALYLSYTDTYC